MTVYVLTCNWATDGSCGDSVNVYSSKEKAIKAMNEMIEDDRNANSISDDWEEEKSETYYAAWEDGWYAHNHIEYNITESKVQ